MEMKVVNDEGAQVEIRIQDPDVRDYIDENWGDLEGKLALVLKVGVGAIKASSTAVDTNYVDKEFDKLQVRFNERFRLFQEEWDTKVQVLFGEDFRNMKECMDPDKPDTPTRRTVEMIDERMKTLMSDMDPAEESTPIGRFRKEMLMNLKELRDLFQAKRAAEEVEEKTTLKGLRYEDVVFDRVHSVGTTFMDSVQSTGDIPGIGSSKKGDVVAQLHGHEGLSVVMEIKDSGTLKINDGYYKKEILSAMENRGASASILIAHPSVYPVDKPLFVWKDRCVVCRYDPDLDDDTILEVAYQLARDIAIRAVLEGPEEFSLSEFEETLKEISLNAQTLESIERKLSRSINNLGDIRDELNRVKTNIRANLKELMDRISPEEK